MLTNFTLASHVDDHRTALMSDATPKLTYL